MKRLLIVTAVIVGLSLAAAWVRHRRRPDDAFRDIQRDWSRAEISYREALRRARSPEERRRAAAEVGPDLVAFASRFMKLARAHPGTPAELAALCWAASNAPGDEPGRQALSILSAGRLARADLTELMTALISGRSGRVAASTPLAPLVLRRAARDLGHPGAARLLSWVCASYALDDSAQAPPAFDQAANLIVARFPDSPDIAEFCESLGCVANPPWAGAYETHLRAILDRSRDRRVRQSALFALASLARSRGEARRLDAEALFRRVIEECEAGAPSTTSTEGFLAARAGSELHDMRLGDGGVPAGEIVGEDLDGRPMRLAEFRGKVVLVSFWATWCGPCMRMIPHERSLLARFAGRPFAIVGVNGDDDLEEMRRSLRGVEMGWRSFRNSRAGAAPIAEDWHVTAWPTFYLIDPDGIIRRRWVGIVTDEALESAIAPMVKAAVGDAGRARPEPRRGADHSP